MNETLAKRILEGQTEPLGIPPLYIADQLKRGVPASRVIGSGRTVVAQYAGAEGYCTDWGHILEQRYGHYLAWRINPVSWWQNLEEVRSGQRHILPELIDWIQPRAIVAVAGALPQGVVISGRYPGGKSHPHTLLTLLLIAPRLETEARHWLAEDFLSTVLPPLLDQAREQLLEVLSSPFDNPADPDDATHLNETANVKRDNKWAHIIVDNKAGSENALSGLSSKPY